MATIKAILRKKSNAQMLYPIVIRVTKNRKSSYIYTGQYVDKKYWDDVNQKIKRSHPNASRLNHLLLVKMTEVNEKLLEMQYSKKKKSISKFKKELFNHKSANFQTVSNLYLDNINNRKKINQYLTEKNRIEQFIKFSRNSELEFQDIDTSLLRKFESFLLYNKKLKSRTVANYMITIRTVYNLAIREDYAERNNYPFGRGRYQIRIPDTKKIGLTIEEVRCLEEATGLSDAQQHALNVWLLSFYFAGMRITDVIQLKWKDLKDNRLYYRMNKNSKLVSLKIPNKAQKIIDQYSFLKTTTSNLVFPDLWDTNLDDPVKLRIRIKTITRNFNRHLKIIANSVGIEKNLSMHTSRHTFGHISGDKIPIQMLQKLYRHSSITTTMQYQANFINKDADEALDKVIDF